MTGRYEGFHFLRDADDEIYAGFEVFWQPEGWFWRPLLMLDGKAVGSVYQEHGGVSKRIKL
jgi:hypothetical protein